MEKFYKENEITTQGTNTPVSAAVRGGQAGSRASISSDCNAFSVSLAGIADNATSTNTKGDHGMKRDKGKGDHMDAVNPFARNSKIRRSPQHDEPGSNEREGNPNTEPTAFCRLGVCIRNLVEMLEDGKRRSIHQPMRDTIESIKVLYELSAIENHDEKAKEVIRSTKSSQTSPWLRMKEPKRKQEEKPEEPTAKRVNESRKTEATKQQQTANLRENDGWKVATSKARTKRSKENRSKVRPKPDAIVIEATGNSSYADILRKVKTDPCLSELGQAVSRIRRTNNGKLLLQLRNKGERTDEYKEAIGQSLNGQASVRSLKPRRIIVVKDIDEVTTKEEILRTIRTQLKLRDEEPVEMVNLRSAYGGTQIAKISLPVDKAEMLLKTGKVVTNWAIWRIREEKSILKCFRCLEFGHVARVCKNSLDRSKMCRRCGEEGHIAKMCEKNPVCMFCRNEDSVDSAHIAGSNKCPVFRRALAIRK